MAVAQGIPFMARLLLAAAQGILSRICTVGRYSPTKLRNGAFLLAEIPIPLRKFISRPIGDEERSSPIGPEMNFLRGIWISANRNAPFQRFVGL